MTQTKQFLFNIEWLPETAQYYHGPRSRMREMSLKYPRTEDKPVEQVQLVEFLLANYAKYASAINKLKFYRIADDKSPQTLWFFVLWCDYDLEAREVFFEQSETILIKTGWYPMVTGHRTFHHHRYLLDFIDAGLRKAMNKVNIERLPGLGVFESISSFGKGAGTSIHIQTSAYDLILDSGMPEDNLYFERLLPNKRKWIFVSHSHKDHTGGLYHFVKDRNFVISSSPISLELYFNAIDDENDITALVPKDFFYRFAPMWYRSVYRFSDGSSIEPIPTYHFPGSMGYLFTFSDCKTLFYSGDLNVAASYEVGTQAANNIGLEELKRRLSTIDYGVFDAAFVGRRIGFADNTEEQLADHILDSICRGRNHAILAPPSDYGLFTFLHLYNCLISGSKKANVRIFLDHQIIRQLEILEWRMKRKQSGSLDDVLMSFLARRATIAESVNVFSFHSNLDRNLDELNRRNMQALFILDDQKAQDPDYFSDFIMAKMELHGLDISRVGKAATRPFPAGRFEASRIIDFDGSVWFLHSSEKKLRNYFLAQNPKFGQIYLFHNFKGRTDKFTKHLIASGFDTPVSCL